MKNIMRQIDQQTGTQPDLSMKHFLLIWLNVTVQKYIIVYNTFIVCVAHSLGAMCHKGWRSKRLNPAGMRIVCREKAHDKTGGLVGTLSLR